jgi:ketosteroid isomerase-like protein
LDPTEHVGKMLARLGENDDRVRCLTAVYTAISRGDVGVALEALPLDPDVELIEPPEFPEGGRHLGRDAAEQYFRRSRAAWEELDLIPEQFLDAGDRVVAFVRARGIPAGGGPEVEASFADVVTIVEGRLVRIEAYLDRADALRLVDIR